MRVFNCGDEEQRSLGLDAATQALSRGALVVIPTDTVYGIAADAFSPDAVTRLLDAKGRGRQMPPPVLIPDVSAAADLAESITPAAQVLMERLWPGALTIICPARALAWDLGETHETVALRMPDHPLALDLMRRTGPLAVSSANTTGQPPARTIDQALADFDDSVEVYLDDGPSSDADPSTIVDATGDGLRMVRRGAIDRSTLADIVGEEIAEEATT